MGIRLKMLMLTVWHLMSTDWCLLGFGDILKSVGGNGTSLFGRLSLKIISRFCLDLL